jgi:hypothetical protein
MGPNGQVLEAYDLYLGARIPILGRLTTLKQASMLTQQWLELQQKHLSKCKKELEKELAKYELFSLSFTTITSTSSSSCSSSSSNSNSSNSSRKSSIHSSKEEKERKERRERQEEQKSINSIVQHVPTKTLSTSTTCTSSTPSSQRHVHSIQVFSLRQVKNQVDELKRRLAKYRPDIVRRIMSRCGIPQMS